ncbi:MAG: hypothetical protein IK135_02580 [Bacteroidales bacterium]|nr:hypothetical protein [Bacteroidales bacterium]
MKELKIKTFMIDSRRPTWLIQLLHEVKQWFPFEEVNEMSCDQCFSWIENAMERTTLVKRNSRYRLTDCVRKEIKDNKLTIYTLYKDNPMVEFEIAEKGGAQ